MAYKYETHLHSSPVSRCATSSLSDSLPFYKKLGYDGVFVTNHFLNGNIGGDKNMSRQELLEFYCQDYFDGLKIARETGIKLFFGVEMTYDGLADFLIYGLSPEWYLEHPEILDLSTNHLLEFLKMNKAYIIHAHPFRDRAYTPAIHLFPKYIDAVETLNACNLPNENKLAEAYAKLYKFSTFAGSDNHIGSAQKKLAGIITNEPINSEEDFVSIMKGKKYKLFIK